MQSNYDFVMRKNILPSEGLYCWDAGDPGGPTKYGITYIDLAQHRNEPRSTPASWAARVKAMDIREAMDIYDTKYARGIHFADLPSGFDYTDGDYGINSGNSRAIRVTQHLLSRPETGKFNFDDLNAIAKANAKDLIHAVCAERLHFMHQIRGGDAWARFGKGWGTRVTHVESTSIMLNDRPIRGSAIIIPDHVEPPVATGKATHTPDPQVTKNIVKGTGASSVGSQAGHAMYPMEYVVVAGVALVVVGAATLAGYHLLHKYRNNKVVLPEGIEKLA